jgi:putative acetyltransferase
MVAGMSTGRVEAGGIRVRPARDDDGDGLIELIGACWAEYPGTVMDVDGELPHLRAIASAYRAWGGSVWVAEAGGRVLGSVALVPAGEDAVELRMLYVSPDARRGGLGGRLLGLVEAEARRLGAGRVELWSDTRFTTAHRFYERRGYERGPATRELHDLSASVEYFYARSL